VRLHDTRLKSVVDIEPLRPGLMTIYACGPTVYRDAHVGNMRTFLLTDLIRRVAELEGNRVVLVQNITDVGHMADDTGLAALGPQADEGQGGTDEDDKVLQQAAAEGRTALDVARHYEARFHADLNALNIRPADHYPRASESIDLMIDLIARLIDSGHAYIGADESIYFSAQSFSGYGELSGNRLEDLRPGHRMTEADPAKRFHADWALWKKASEKRTQLVWDTPWGAGFPGWHTECSAMSLSLLGDSIDIHTGGIDLRFPHHEDERAQSNAATGRDVVRHWVHGEHLLFEGRKMSKSSGNVVLVSDVAARGLDPLALRLAFLQNRYRQQVNLTWEGIEAADVMLRRWRGRVAEWATYPSAPMPAEYRARFEAAVSDDLDMPRALQVLREVEKDASLADGSRLEFFLHADRVLGLDLAIDIGRRSSIEVPAEVAALAEQRAAARAAKDWAESDRLRDAIADLGWTVTDSKDGQQLQQ